MFDEAGVLFVIYVEDDRYAVPTLRLFVAADDLHARQVAATILRESAHHRGVELRRGDRRIAALGACAPQLGS